MQRSPKLKNPTPKYVPGPHLAVLDQALRALVEGLGVPAADTKQFDAIRFAMKKLMFANGATPADYIHLGQCVVDILNEKMVAAARKL